MELRTVSSVDSEQHCCRGVRWKETEKVTHEKEREENGLRLPALMQGQVMVFIHRGGSDKTSTLWIIVSKTSRKIRESVSWRQSHMAM